MKLPKTIAQWEKLDSLAKQRVNEVSEQVITLLTQAGYTSPHEPDENGDEIGDEVQSLLMDALLRSPMLYLHITKLTDVESMEPPIKRGDKVGAWSEQAMLDWADQGRTVKPESPSTMDEVAERFKAKFMELTDRQREFGENAWSETFGPYDRPYTAAQWELMWRTARYMSKELIGYWVGRKGQM